MTDRPARPVQPALPLVVPRLTRPVVDRLAAQIAPGWVSAAACASADLGPDAWHTDPGEPGHAAARAVCSSCPVRRSCLAHALVADEPEGIWGGADESERAWLRLALADRIPVLAVLGPATSAAVA